MRIRLIQSVGIYQIIDTSMNLFFQLKNRYQFNRVLNDIAGKGYYEIENTKKRIYTSDEKIISLIQQLLLLYRFEAKVVNVLVS